MTPALDRNGVLYWNWARRRNHCRRRQAFDYALERCLKGTPEDQKIFREELVEWYYSGNWLKREGDVPV